MAQDQDLKMECGARSRHPRRVRSSEIKTDSIAKRGLSLTADEFKNAKCTECSAMTAYEPTTRLTSVPAARRAFSFGT